MLETRTEASQGNGRRPRPRRHLWEATAAVLVGTAVLSTLSPQIAQIGHGLRVTLPCLLFGLVAILEADKHALARAVTRLGWSLAAGTAFVVQALLRFAWEPNSETFLRAYCLGPALALITCYCIEAIAEIGDKSLAQMRTIVLLGWCSSLALGIPTLFGEPGVARTTMGSDLASANAEVLAPMGVGEYTTYTSLAVSAGPLLLIGLGSRGLKGLKVALVTAACVAVGLSTFSMATALLLVNLLSFPLIAGFTGSRRKRAAWLLVCLSGIVIGLRYYSEAETLPQTGFVIGKLERLAYGVRTAGLAEGDETERGAWLVEELKSTLANPLWGATSGVSSVTYWGHSSLSNSLTLFGVLLGPLWWVAVAKMWRLTARRAAGRRDRTVGALAWALFACGGVLNPLWHSPGPVAALFALTLREEKSRGKGDRRAPGRSATTLRGKPLERQQVDRYVHQEG